MKHNHSLNFRTFPHKEISLSINDRGFMYGDGFFETLTLINSRVRFWDYHWERIQKGISIFKFNSTAISEQKLLNEIKHLSEINQLHTSTLKINFWRAEGGLFIPSSTNFNVLIQQKEVNSHPADIIHVGISKNVVNHYSLLSEIKTMSSAKYILAGLEIKHSKYDDLIILDTSGYVSELSSSNLFIIKKNKMYTPPITTGCVNGVFRKAICNFFSITEKPISLEEIKNCDAALATNASGIKVLKAIEDNPLNISHPLLSEVIDWLKQLQHP